MSNLVISILGIMLFAVITIGGIMYVDMGVVGEKQNSDLVKRGFLHLISEYHVYKSGSHEALASSNWENVIKPPRSLEDMEWQYKKTDNGSYFCLIGSMYSEEFYSQSKRELSSNFNSLFVSDVCGATVQDESFSDGDVKAFTIWLDSEYDNMGLQNHVNFDVFYENFQGEWILFNGGDITVYQGEPVRFRVYSEDEDASLMVNDLADVTETFVCEDGSSGCNTGISRLLKIETYGEFNGGILELTLDDGDLTKTKKIAINSSDRFVCNEIDPLNGIDQDGDGYYMIGGLLGHPLNAKAQLLCLSQNQHIGATGNPLTAKYKLSADIDFDSDHDAVDWDGSGVAGDGVDYEGWIPLGDYAASTLYRFRGTFDGAGHKIRNLYINRGEDWQGFFGNSNGKLRNLTLESILVLGRAKSALLVGEGSGADIDNVYVDGSIVAQGDYIGGISGIAWSANIHSSGVKGSVTGNNNVGGFVGQVNNNTVITDSFSTALVDGFSQVGGFVGYAGSCNINACYASGSVTASSTAGGFVGIGGGSFSNCYAKGSVYGGSDVGGFQGRAWGTIIDTSYATGDVNGSFAVGGLGGYFYGSTTVYNSYATGAVNGSATLGGLIGYDGASINNINDTCYYTDGNVSECEKSDSLIIKRDLSKGVWDDYIWENLNDYHPRLEWESSSYYDSNLSVIVPAVCSSNDPLENVQFIDGKYMIGNNADGSITGNAHLAKQQLLCLSNFQTDAVKSSDYIMTTNVFFNASSAAEDWNGDGVVDAYDSGGWNAIRDYSGVFNGDDYIIYNLYINKPTSNYQGMFSTVEREVKNLKLENLDITGNANVGGVTGYLHYANRISNVYVNGSISGVDSVGGVVGDGSSSALVYNSSVNADVTGNNNVGGVVGLGASVQYTIYDGDVNGSGNRVGGLVGQSRYGLIQYSSASGTVSGQDYVGGIVGEKGTGSTVRRSFSSSNISGNNNIGGIIGYTSNKNSIDDVYALGNVYGNDKIGGIVGCAKASVSDPFSLANAYASGEVTGVSNMGALIGFRDLNNTTVNDTYAINSNTTAIGNWAYNSDNYCSYTADAGCSIKYVMNSIKDDWDDSIWEDLADNRPKLEWQNTGDIDSEYIWECNPSNPLANIDVDGTGNYLIGNATGSSSTAKSQLLCLSQNQMSSVLSANYRMTADVYFGPNYEQVDWNGDGSADGVNSSGWIPLGTASAPFSGHIIGGGYSVHNIYINLDQSGDIDAGLFGYANSMYIEKFNVVDSYINVKSSSGLLNAGLMIGRSIGSHFSEVKTSGYIYVSSTGSSPRAGGLLGYSDGDVVEYSNSSALVDVSSTVAQYTYVGGLVGYMKNASVSEVYATGTVNASADDKLRIGGLVGYFNGILSLSYATGNVTATDENTVGGLVGFLYGTSSSSSQINKSYATGDVLGADNTGGLVGYSTDSNINNSYANATVVGSNGVGGLVGTFVPGLGGISDSYSSGSVSGVIKVGGLIGDINGNSAVSILYSSAKVSGEGYIGGLIGSYSGDIHISNSFATGDITASTGSAGGLIGSIFNNGSLLVESSFATGDVHGIVNVGGLIGLGTNADVSSCYAVGAVSGNDLVGGLVGSVVDDIGSTLTIGDCFATGSVNSAGKAGGLVAHSDADIKDSYATGIVSGGNVVAGLVADSDADIKDSYAMGSVSATGSDVAGLVEQYVTISNNNGYCAYYDNTNSCSPDKVPLLTSSWDSGTWLFLSEEEGTPVFDHVPEVIKDVSGNLSMYGALADMGFDISVWHNITTENPQLVWESHLSSPVAEVAKVSGGEILTGYFSVARSTVDDKIVASVEPYLDVSSTEQADIEFSSTTDLINQGYLMDSILGVDSSSPNAHPCGGAGQVSCQLRDCAYTAYWDGSGAGAGNPDSCNIGDTWLIVDDGSITYE